jgi:peptide chain release factor 3
MLVDGAKGIEDRTRKLFEVCRMRQLPVFSFVNKMDRPALSPFELIDQLENEFKLEICPMVHNLVIPKNITLFATDVIELADW